jgi:hypothetical protein
MTRLPLDQIAPGSVLAADARDRQGRLLLPAGHELSLRTLESLRFWGVLRLDVVGETRSAEVEPFVSPEMVAQAREEVRARFANAGPPHPFLHVLRTIAVERRARDLAADKVGP